MTSHASPKYALDYVVGGNATQKHNSLTDGGPLKLQAEHWLFKVLAPSEFDRTHGDIRTSVHKIEWLMLDIFVWSPALKARNMAWVLKNSRTAKFLYKADSLGHLPWDKKMTLRRGNDPSPQDSQVTASSRSRARRKRRRLIPRDVRWGHMFLPYHGQNISLERTVL